LGPAAGDLRAEVVGNDASDDAERGSGAERGGGTGAGGEAGGAAHLGGSDGTAGAQCGGGGGTARLAVADCAAAEGDRPHR
jgi:hypothetical protein